MQNRGLFKDIFKNSQITTTRELKITLLKSLDIWVFTALSNEINDNTNIKSSIQKQINDFCFPQDDFKRLPVYYISIRPKVRIIKCKKMNYCDNSSMSFTITEGTKKYKIKTKIQSIANFLNVDVKEITEVLFQDKYIFCKYKNDHGMIITVYDLLNLSEFRLQEKNEIYYIGYTKNPSKRPFDGNHSGLNTVLYNYYDKREHDIFISYQQFHVNSLIEVPNMVFQASNTMLDEIAITTEAKIIESSLIERYIPNLRKNYLSESGYLKNVFIQELNDAKIETLNFLLDYSISGSLFRYRNNYNSIDNFRIAVKENKLEIQHITKP